MQPKRILISLLAVILICLAAGLTVSAAETSPLNLAVTVTSDAAISNSPVTVQAGDTLEVSVTVAENPGVAYLEFDLVYDPAVVSVKTEGGNVACENGTIFSASEMYVKNTVPGVLTVGYMGNGNKTTTNATLFTVEFTVLACADATKGASAISLVVNPGEVANADIDFVDVALANDGKAAFVAHNELTVKEAAKAPCVSATYECPACKEQFVAEPEAEHTLVKSEPVAAQCGVPGKSEGESCSACGLVTIEVEEIPALEHDLVPVSGQPADCLNDGWEAYVACSRCDYATEKVTIPALNHDLETTPAKAPTCAEEGWEAYESCKRCDYAVSKVTIPATGAHTPVTDPAVEPTYSSEGKTEGSHCSVCGKVLVEQEVIPAKSLLWLWIVIAVVVVAGAGVAVYFFVYKKQAQTKHIGRPGSQK